MNSSGGRLDATAAISQQPIFSVSNSRSEFVLNDNKNEELKWGSFEFKNGTQSSTQFLDSPSFVFNSNIFSSPTTGNYHVYDFKEEKTYAVESNSQLQTGPTTIFGNKMEESINSQVLDSNYRSQQKEIDLSMEAKKIKLESEESPQKESNFGTIQVSKEKDKCEDGYNWRKYGQKQVKGSKKPRSYFKCSYPNCPTKKKVEKDLNGYITQIIYKGKHNHPVPRNMKKTSLNSFQNAIFEYTLHKSHFESFSHNSLESIGENKNDQGFSISKAENDSENEPKFKKWKLDEVESETISCGGSRTLQEPKVVIEMRSEVDILDDGYKWRKYGQKVIKGNPNPRSYYKCINIGCPVRKLVERASHDLQVVVTTYEAKHNHGVPAPRGGRYATNQPPMSNGIKTSNNHMPVISRPLPNYSYNDHGMRGFTSNNVQTHIQQTLEDSKYCGSLESSYPNQEWERVFLSTTKEEPINELFYNLL